MDPRLYKAATQGNVQALKELIDKEPKLINSVTPHDHTLLHIAARLGHNEFAEELLRWSDAFLILKNADEDTALHIAARAGHLDMVVFFIHHSLAWPTDIKLGEEGPLRLTNKLGNTALHEAVKNRYTRIARQLLSAEPTASHMLNVKKETPLHIAAREGLIQVVSEILEYPWVPPREEEELPPVGTGSPLHQAVLGGHCFIMELLLQERRDFINVVDKEGNTALHYAARKNNAKMVEMLLMCEPSLAYCKNEEGYSSLLVAAAHGTSFSIKELLKQCPDAAEQVDFHGRNALHIAVVSRNVGALKCLLKIIPLEEIINQADDEGNTPLHLAARKSRISSTMVLLKDKRVDPCILNKDGLTPRGVIESSEQQMDTYEIHIMQLLKKSEDRRCKKHPELSAFGNIRGSFRKKMYSTATDEHFKSCAATYSLVAALIATVTFAATFTMPGGYNNESGYALLEQQGAFKAFVISDTIAMCSSLIVVFCFIWAWKDPVRFKVHQMTWGHRLIILASVAMLVALMTSVYVVVAKHCMWLAIVVCSICCCSPFVLWAILGHDILFIPVVKSMSAPSKSKLKPVSDSEATGKRKSFLTFTCSARQGFVITVPNDCSYFELFQNKGWRL